jgi:branched-chain amino acid transport system ATP-binding protein
MLNVSELDVHYGHVQALWGVSMRIDAGQTASLIGGNGAGKTTLASTLAGLLRATSGTVTLDGIDLLALPVHQRGSRGGISIVPEGRRVFGSLTVAENLMVGALRTPAAERNRLLEQMYELFPRLAERPTQLAGSMSGGEQAMVAMSRALMAGPKLLVLDEPSQGLAPTAVDLLFDAIAKVRTTGVSILLIEQETARAMAVSDYTYLMAEGRIALQGPSEEMASNELVRKSIVGA